jgi:hypothetical protein
MKGSVCQRMIEWHTWRVRRGSIIQITAIACAVRYRSYWKDGATQVRSMQIAYYLLSN